MADILRRDAALPPDYSKLEAHSLANLMPMIGDREFEDLKADILKNGLQIPIQLYEGKVLDGRNRHKALKALVAEGKIAFKSSNFVEFIGAREAAHAFVFSANFNRRQLSNKQKRDVIKKVVEEYPDKSNRAIAQICSVSHSLVGDVREEMAEPDKKAKAEFEGFCKTFDSWDDKYRKDFVERFKLDLREMLGR